MLRRTAVDFGTTQYQIYRALLDEAIDAVAGNPNRRNSKERPDLGDGIRTFHLGVLTRRRGAARHLLVYRVHPDGYVEILRILHEAMKVPHNLEN